MQWLFETKKRDTKLPQLIRAVVKLFVEQGIDATTTKQIAETADVAEGTLYRHFRSFLESTLCFSSKRSLKE